MKVIIAGSREWTDKDRISAIMDIFIDKVGPISEVVQGDCSGADLLGSLWADEHGITVVSCPAMWGKIPNAGRVRNTEMAKYADALVLFWFGDSPGSRDMRKQAIEHKLLVWDVYPESFTVISPQNELPL